MFQVVNLWDLRNYSFKATVPTYEALESVCVIPKDNDFLSCITSHISNGNMMNSASPPMFFFTVGERGIVRAWSSTGYALLNLSNTTNHFYHESICISFITNTFILFISLVGCIQML